MSERFSGSVLAIRKRGRTLVFLDLATDGTDEIKEAVLKAGANNGFTMQEVLMLKRRLRAGDRVYATGMVGR